MSEEMRQAVIALQTAVDEELKRKAKLGYKAVIADKNGKPKLVSARSIIRKKNKSVLSAMRVD